VWVTVGIVALSVVVGLVAWRVADVLLVVFAGLLLAIVLRGLADALAARLPLPAGVSLAIVIIVLLGVLGLGGWLLSGDVARQVDQLGRDLPRAVESLREQLAGYEWGRTVVAALPRLEDLIADGGLVHATGAVSRTLGATLGLVVNVVIVSFVGLYVAADPELYSRGLLRLVPIGRRARTRDVLATLRHTLQWWLIGKLVVMTLVGTLTGFGLWALGLPLALTLGLLAGLLDFIPYFGPVLAFVPAILLALTQSLTLTLWVVGLYIVVQALESYVLTPLVQQRAVALAPALTIISQIVLTVLFGPLGLLLATPLTAAGLVLVRMLYVEDALGDTEAVQSAGPAPARRRSA
jgi:predicted PurR-regulated permease PerM